MVLYNEVLRHIKDTIVMEYPAFDLANIKFCMSDFEPAILGAMTMAFPAATAKGCWFHYGQAIYRKASELGLSPSYKKKGVVYKIVKGSIHANSQMCPAVISPILFKFGEWMKDGEKNYPRKY